MIVDLFVLDLAGANLVLGIQWFKSVGKVLSDYTDMAIEFDWQGHRIRWMGESLISDEPYSTNELKNLATTSVNAFFCMPQYVANSELLNDT